MEPRLSPQGVEVSRLEGAEGDQAAQGTPKASKPPAVASAAVVGAGKANAARSSRAQRLVARYEKMPTATQAVGLKCLDCVGGDQDRDWSLNIARCTIQRCALWPHRPYKGGK